MGQWNAFLGLCAMDLFSWCCRNKGPLLRAHGRKKRQQKMTTGGQSRNNQQAHQKKGSDQHKKIQDDYKKFYEQFGKCLKLGVHEDRGSMFPAWNYLHMTMCVCVWFEGIVPVGLKDNTRASHRTPEFCLSVPKKPRWS